MAMFIIMKSTIKYVKAIGIIVWMCSGALLIGQEKLSSTALPEGGVVVGGAADLGTRDNLHTIRAKTDRVAVRYDDGFNIGVQGTVDVVGLPGGAALIQDANPRGNLSQLHGRLNSNIDVVLLNSNGVLIGKDFKADTKSLTVGALQGVADDFMKRGEMQLRQSNSGARIVNEGAVLDRNVILLAPKIEDQAAQATRHVGSDFLIQLNPEKRGGQGITVRLPDSQGSVLRANHDQIYAQAMNIEAMAEQRIRITRDGRIRVSNVPTRSKEAERGQGANPPLITVNQNVDVPRGLVDVSRQAMPVLDVTAARRAEPVVVAGGAIVANPKPLSPSLPRVDTGVEQVRTQQAISNEITLKDFPKQNFGHVPTERRSVKIKINEPDIDAADDRSVVTVEPLPTSVLLIRSPNKPDAPKIQIMNTEIALDREAEDAVKIDVLPAAARR